MKKRLLNINSFFIYFQPINKNKMAKKKRKLSTYRDFIKWAKSDNVVKTISGFVTQCGQYRKTYTRKELYIYYKHEYVN